MACRNGGTKRFLARQWEDHMAKILGAAAPEPRAILERILAGHEFFARKRWRELSSSFARKLSITSFARSSSTSPGCLICCGSQSVGLSGNGSARLRRHILDSPLALEGVAFTCQAWGAVAFLNVADYQVDPEREMRDAIEPLLDTTSRRDS
jgi:hypothetical protein